MTEQRPDWRELRHRLYGLADLADELNPVLTWLELQLIYPEAIRQAEEAARLARDLLTDAANATAENGPTLGADLAPLQEHHPIREEEEE